MGDDQAKHFVLFFFLIDSVLIFGLWGVQLSQDAFPRGVFVPHSEVSLPALHLAAEFLMAGVTLAGIIAIWSGAGWGKGLALFGVGMFTYSAVNSLGWAVVNDPIQGLPMTLTICAAAVAFPLLVRYHDEGEEA